MSRRTKDKGAFSGELFAPAGARAGGRPVLGFLIDVEGTLVRADSLARGGCEPLRGAAGLLAALEARGIPFWLMTNATALPPEEAARRLRAAGLPVDGGQLLTPASVLADLLGKQGARALVLGGPGAAAPLEAAAGIDVLRPGELRADEVDAVFVADHADAVMADIEAAARAVWAGARLYVASDAPFVAASQAGSAGRELGRPHALAAAIRAATGAAPTLVGKPSGAAFAHAQRLLDAPADQIAVVGDEPAQDVAMARAAGAMAVAVCTDAVDRDDWEHVEPALAPDLLLDSAGDLEAKLEELCEG